MGNVTIQQMRLSVFRLADEDEDTLAGQMGDNAARSTADSITRWLSEAVGDLTTTCVPYVSSLSTSWATTTESVSPGPIWGVTEVIWYDAGSVNAYPLTREGYDDLRRTFGPRRFVSDRVLIPAYWYTLLSSVSVWPRPFAAGAVTVKGYARASLDDYTDTFAIEWLTDEHAAACVRYALAQLAFKNADDPSLAQKFAPSMAYYHSARVRLWNSIPLSVRKLWFPVSPAELSGASA